MCCSSDPRGALARLLCDNRETAGIDIDIDIDCDIDSDGTVDPSLYDMDGEGVVGSGEAADPSHKDLCDLHPADDRRARTALGPGAASRRGRASVGILAEQGRCTTSAESW